MQLSDGAASTLYRALESYLCAYGQDYEQLFGENSHIREAYETMKQRINTINEATPKSTREKMHRKTRKTIKSKKRYGNLSDTDFTDRVRPEKSANNDPDRGGNRIHNKPLDIQESLIFIRDNFNKYDNIRDKVLAFEHKETLRKTIRQMIATRLGGWSDRGTYYENKDGTVASKNNWNLMEDGKLYPVNGNMRYDYDLDWLLEVHHCFG